MCIEYKIIIQGKSNRSTDITDPLINYVILVFKQRDVFVD